LTQDLGAWRKTLSYPDNGRDTGPLSCVRPWRGIKMRTHCHADTR